MDASETPGRDVFITCPDGRMDMFGPMSAAKAEELALSLRQLAASDVTRSRSAISIGTRFHAARHEHKAWNPDDYFITPDIAALAATEAAYSAGEVPFPSVRTMLTALHGEPIAAHLWAQATGVPDQAEVAAVREAISANARAALADMLATGEQAAMFVGDLDLSENNYSHAELESVDASDAIIEVDEALRHVRNALRAVDRYRTINVEARRDEAAEAAGQ